MHIDDEIVVDDKAAVLGLLDVHLYAVRADFHRLAESGKGVFRRKVRCAPVCNDLWCHKILLSSLCSALPHTASAPQAVQARSVPADAMTFLYQ